MKIKRSAVSAMLSASNRLEGKFPVKTTYAIVRNLRLLTAEAAEIEAARVKLVKEFDPTGTQVPKEREPDFFRKVSEGLADETDVALFELSSKALNLYDPETNPTGNVINPKTLADLGEVFKIEE